MKVKYGIQFSLVTLLFLTAGLFLPRIVFAWQNQGAAVTPRIYAMETIELDKAAPMAILDVLRLVSGEHESMLLETGNVLGAEGAYEAAADALAFLSENGFDFDAPTYSGSSGSTHKQSPSLVFAPGGKEAAVVWQCEWASADGESNILMHLDDETGKMLSFQYVNSNVSEEDYGRLPIKMAAEDWARLCVRYYGFQSAEVEVRVPDDATRLYDINFVASDGSNLQLSLQIMYASSSVSESKTFKSTVSRWAVSFNLFSLN